MIHLVHVKGRGVLLGHCNPYENVFMLRMEKARLVGLKSIASSHVQMISDTVLRGRIEQLRLGVRMPELYLNMSKMEWIITVDQDFWTPYIDTDPDVLAQIEPPSTVNPCVEVSQEYITSMDTYRRERDRFLAQQNAQQRGNGIRMFVSIVRSDWTKEGDLYRVDSSMLTAHACRMCLGFGATYDASGRNFIIYEADLEKLERSLS